MGCLDRNKIFFYLIEIESIDKLIFNYFFNKNNKKFKKK